MLTTLDRTNTATFEITHEFFAMLLGVRRSSVSTLTEMLSDRGVIESTRGRVRVRDRKALEAYACECYEVIRRNFAEYERHTTKRVRLKINPIALTGD